MPLAFAITDDPSAAETQFVENELSAFNVQRARPYDKRPLNLFLRDDAGRLVGGLTGYTNWEWLYVDCFWLPESARRSGLGAQMLRAAEDEARARGCRNAHLYSYSFQAPAFYEKQGYARYGALEDYPPGQARVLFRKAL